MNYGQFCPISKATEILGERWTVLILRELLMGATRFNELQRGLGAISPALLTGRLKSLERQGLVARRRSAGGKSHEYYPTQACKELMPVLFAMGEWALCWTRRSTADDYDADLLMVYLERSINPDALPGKSGVVRFEFSDVKRHKNWWLVAGGGEVDLCIKDPGRDIDIDVRTSLRTMTDVWMGDRSYRQAMSSGELSIDAAPALLRDITAWLRPSIFANSERRAPPTRVTSKRNS